MNFKEIIICTYLLTGFSMSVYSQNRKTHTLSVGSHFATAGSKSSYIETNSYWTFPYVGAGVTVEYLSHFNRITDTNVSASRIGLAIGTRMNYTRYGFTGTFLFPILNHPESKIRTIHLNIIQVLEFRVTRNLNTSLYLMEGMRFSRVTGDTLVSRIYGIVEGNNQNNLKKFSADVGIDLSLKITSNLNLSIGYVQGVVNIIKNNSTKYVELREYYPYIRFTKYL